MLASPLFLLCASPLFLLCASPFNMMPHRTVMLFHAWNYLRSNQHAVVENIGVQLLTLSGDNSSHLNDIVGRRSLNTLHMEWMHISGVVAICPNLDIG